MEYHLFQLLNSCCFEIFENGNMLFLREKVDGNMTFTDYRNVFLLIFSEMGNMVFP